MMGENEKRFMYIDFKYPIDNSLPRHLLAYIRELEEYYDNDDWIGFDCLLEGIEATTKAYQLSGIITEKQLDTLFRRYGIR